MTACSYNCSEDTCDALTYCKWEWEFDPAISMQMQGWKVNATWSNGFQDAKVMNLS